MYYNIRTLPYGHITCIRTLPKNTRIYVHTNADRRYILRTYKCAYAAYRPSRHSYIRVNNTSLTRTYLHLHIRTYIHTKLHTWIRTYKIYYTSYVYVHRYILKYLHAYIRSCGQTRYISTWVHLYIPLHLVLYKTYERTRTYGHTYKVMSTNVRTYERPSDNNYILTHLQTYIPHYYISAHTWIHIKLYIPTYVRYVHTLPYLPLT
jgi:hypothetical protein